MRLSVSGATLKTQPLIAFAFEKEAFPAALPQQKNLIADAANEGFKAKENSICVLHPKSGSPARTVILAGLGERKNVSNETLRRAAAAAVKRAQSLQAKAVSILLPQALGDPRREAQVTGEGAGLAAYRFDKYKSERKDPQVKEAVLIAPAKLQDDVKKGARTAQLYTDATAFARDLVNEPPSDLTPARFAEPARDVAAKGEGAGITLTVYEKDQIEEMKMGAILGVNRGSAEPPVLLHFQYKPEGAARKIALVGKGITFDSGGLSLKPAESMETMKCDMAGAASILGVFRAIPALKPKVEIHGILALTENMPGGRAQKPGDVLKTMSGKTIEVLNTDAEGRLILADALTYAVKQNPDAIIDLATLTGACVIALGGLVAGAMGNNDDLFNAIQRAGDEAGEPIWRLPLVKDYRDGLKSPIADIKNISSIRREGGSIIGGLFLQEFVENKPWLHLDIAGPAWTDREFHYLTHGGTGFPVRTLLNYLTHLN